VQRRHCGEVYDVPTMVLAGETNLAKNRVDISNLGQYHMFMCENGFLEDQNR
jgi:hypothetical protein